MYATRESRTPATPPLLPGEERRYLSAHSLPPWQLAVCGAAARALRTLPPERVHSEGEKLVRKALLEEPAVISQAAAAGVELRSPEQVGAATLRECWSIDCHAVICEYLRM